MAMAKNVFIIKIYWKYLEQRILPALRIEMEKLIKILIQRSWFINFFAYLVQAMLDATAVVSIANRY